MDDRRFDSFARSLASGASRRSILKGLLGLGGVALAGNAALERDAGAARRPTPTPKPPICPGQQTWNGSQCVCPPAAPEQCGSDCCNPAAVGPAHSECCDNACCFGTCYGEELCCASPRTFCDATGECCPIDRPYCCGTAGCCATPCCSTTAGLACCAGNTPTCCPNDICVAAGTCCVEADCPGCQDCVDHICVDNDAFCPGGDAGCLACRSGVCQPVNASCNDWNACTSDICNADGTCSYPLNCNGQAACCDDGNACTANVCNTDGTCSNPANCNGLASCCNDGNICTRDVCNGDGTCSNPFDCNLSPEECCPGQLCGDNGQCSQIGCVIEGVSFPPCVTGCPTCVAPDGGQLCGCGRLTDVRCSVEEQCSEIFGTGICAGPEGSAFCVLPANPV